MENKIKEFRLKRKMTQQALADRIGTSKSYICDVERGKLAPGIYRAFELSKVLKCNVYKLFPNDKDENHGYEIKACY